MTFHGFDGIRSTQPTMLRDNFLKLTPMGITNESQAIQSVTQHSHLFPKRARICGIRRL